MAIIYDIETIPHPVTGEKVLAGESFTAPANYKDQDKIDSYILKAKEAARQKLALYWPTLQIVSISYMNEADGKVGNFFNVDEKALLTDFFTYLTNLETTPDLVGKHSAKFDDPVMIGRAIALDLGLPTCLRPNRSITDIENVFGFGQNDQMVSLSKMAIAMGVENKSGKGTDVAHWFTLYQAGETDMKQKIIDYNNQDVVITAEFYRRYRKVFKVGA